MNRAMDDDTPATSNGRAPGCLALVALGAQPARHHDVFAKVEERLAEKWGQSERNGDLALHLQLETRYYTAPVHVVRVVNPSDLPDACEAVCLVMEESLTVKQLLKALAQWSDLESDGDIDCRIAVILGSDGRAPRDDECQDALMEKGWETVFWQATEGAHEWDRVGAARLFEALEATQWRSMKIHPRSRAEAAAAGGSDGEGDDNLDILMSAAAGPRPDINADSSADEGEEATSPAHQRLDSSDSGSDSNADFGQYVAAPAGDLFTGFGASGDPFSGDDELDTLFATVAGLRDTAPVAPGNAIDPQRRRLAERTALDLWRAFGLDDADFSDDGGPEDDVAAPRVLPQGPPARRAGGVRHAGGRSRRRN
ncbi:hypothetical protein H9P43_003487 [Blastocladiella emersonii ATCC 22665]|nr:hypothetical protein H9P43_003487 [Blastocladiella emersonii ATCC 22665]